MSGTPNPYRHQYEVVAASSTNIVLGNTGATGDFLHRVVVNVTTTLTSAFSIIDGSKIGSRVLSNSDKELGAKSVRNRANRPPLWPSWKPSNLASWRRRCIDYRYWHIH